MTEPDPEARNSPPPAAPRLYVSISSGAGIGLLLGLMVGLSVSPIVGVVAGAIASSLAVVLGLNDSHFSPAKGLRIATFGVGGVIGAVLGIYIRTHNLLSPDLAELKSDYVSAGFSEAQALDIILEKHLGLHPKASSGTSPAAITAASVLFSSSVDVSACDDLRTPYDETLSEEEVAENFRLTKGLWAGLASSVEKELPRGDRKAMLFAIRDGICSDRDLPMEQPDCVRLSAVAPAMAKSHSLAPLQTVTGFSGIAKALQEVPNQSPEPVIRVLQSTFCS